MGRRVRRQGGAARVSLSIPGRPRRTGPLRGEQVSARPAALPSPSVPSGAAFPAPQEVSRAFARELSSGRLGAAASFFASDAYFVTPDATAIRGRGGIRAILAQLIGCRVQLRVASQSMHTAGHMALCNERWTFNYNRSDAAPFARASDSTVLLRREERTWKLLIAAPWGLADADRHPFVSTALAEIGVHGSTATDQSPRSTK